jgi:hypothetical protein
VYPKDLEENADYILVNEETEERRRINGGEAIKNGIVFTQPVRSGSIWFYEKLNLKEGE